MSTNCDKIAALGNSHIRQLWFTNYDKFAALGNSHIRQLWFTNCDKIAALGNSHIRQLWFTNSVTQMARCVTVLLSGEARFILSEHVTSQKNSFPMTIHEMPFHDDVGSV
jgi:predicted lipase